MRLSRQEAVQKTAKKGFDEIAHIAARVHIMNITLNIFWSAQ